MFICFEKYSSVINLDLFWKHLFSHNIVTLWLGGGCAKVTEAKARPKMRMDDFGNIFEDQPTWEQSYETFYGRQSGIS